MNKFESTTTTMAVRAAFLAIALLAVGGCGKKTVALTSTESKAFESAPVEVKQAWDSALAADKANDYMNAEKSLAGLKQMQLNDDQKQALDAEFSSFHGRLYQTAETGDAAAIKAVLEIRKNGNRS
jgi:hypothetical protein